MVNDYRTNLVFRIGEVVKRDAAKATEMTKDELSWRYKEFEKVTFKQMLWKFWKPVESFYNEANLLDEGKN